MRSPLVLLVLLCLSTGVAYGGRVAVLEVEGSSGQLVRGELVRAIKKKHTVISQAVWNRQANALDATKPTKANVKKVARKLGLTAVVEASATKRGKEHRVRIRLRSGETGSLLEEVTATIVGSSFDKPSLRDIRDEVVDVISSLDDEKDARAAKRKSKR